MATDIHQARLSSGGMLVTGGHAEGRDPEGNGGPRRTVVKVERAWDGPDRAGAVGGECGSCAGPLAPAPPSTSPVALLAPPAARRVRRSAARAARSAVRAWRASFPAPHAHPSETERSTRPDQVEGPQGCQGAVLRGGSPFRTCPTNTGPTRTTWEAQGGRESKGITAPALRDRGRDRC